MSTAKRADHFRRRLRVKRQVRLVDIGEVEAGLVEVAGWASVECGTVPTSMARMTRNFTVYLTTSMGFQCRLNAGCDSVALALTKGASEGRARAIRDQRHEDQSRAHLASSRGFGQTRYEML